MRYPTRFPERSVVRVPLPGPCVAPGGGGTEELPQTGDTARFQIIAPMNPTLVNGAETGDIIQVWKYNEGVLVPIPYIFECIAPGIQPGSTFYDLYGGVWQDHYPIMGTDITALYDSFFWFDIDWFLIGMSLSMDGSVVILTANAGVKLHVDIIPAGAEERILVTYE